MSIHNRSSAANTAHYLEGHRYHGGGFCVSASEQGCFPFVQNGEVLYFDLSLTSLPASPGGGFQDLPRLFRLCAAHLAAVYLAVRRRVAVKGVPPAP